MTEESDQIARLRAKYLEEIRAHESAASAIRAKLAVLGELASDARQLAQVPVSVGKYSGKKLTKAILDAVLSIGGNGGVTAAQVRQYLVANGYRHRGKNFDVAAVLALNRLSAKGQISTEKKEGRRLYSAKPQ